MHHTSVRVALTRVVSEVRRSYRHQNIVHIHTAFIFSGSEAQLNTINHQTKHVSMFERLTTLGTNKTAYERVRGWTSRPYQVCYRLISVSPRKRENGGKNERRPFVQNPELLHLMTALGISFLGARTVLTRSLCASLDTAMCRLRSCHRKRDSWWTACHQYLKVAVHRDGS